MVVAGWRKAIQSLRPSGFAPAFGRAGASDDAAFMAPRTEVRGYQPCPFDSCWPGDWWLVKHPANTHLRGETPPHRAKNARWGRRMWGTRLGGDLRCGPPAGLEGVGGLRGLNGNHPCRGGELHGWVFAINTTAVIRLRYRERAWSGALRILRW